MVEGRTGTSQPSETQSRPGVGDFTRLPMLPARSLLSTEGYMKGTLLHIYSRARQWDVLYIVSHSRR